MATYTGKHSPNTLAHGAKIPSTSTKQNDKTVAPSQGNTKTGSHAKASAPSSKSVNQDYSTKPMKMPKGGHTS